MALKGTLKDFGIADIFQLISHQSKTGVLHLRSKEREVRISFVKGDIVGAESTTRKRKDLLGAMLVRAGVIGQEQLDKTLENQKRTLKRLGAILVESGFLTLVELQEFTLLQTTETIYQLFNWEDGTYDFEVQEVDYDKSSIEPIRSENVLMEGFRLVDEWPMIRKKIKSFDMTFTLLKDLPPGVDPNAAGDDIDGEFDDFFGGGGEKKKKSSNVGEREAKVYLLIEADRSVQRLVDLSRLGEFETCKALFNLLSGGYIKANPINKDTLGEKPGRRIRSINFGRILVQGVMYIFILGVFYFLYRSVDVLSLLESSPSGRFQNPVTREFVGDSYLQRIHAALTVYRLETGEYPETLDKLVSEKLLSETDLRFPWRNPHAYRKHQDGYVLMRPFE